MKRRSFVQNLMTLTVLGTLAPVAYAADDCQSEESLDLKGTSQGYFEIRHQHQFQIPLSILINPPLEGYSARCSSPLKGKTDYEGLRNRTDSQGNPLDLSGHAHTVTLTQEELLKLSNGRHVTVDLAKFGHQFYFVADDSTLFAIQQARK